MDVSLLRKLGVIDCAVLQPDSGNRFRVQGDAPVWLTEIAEPYATNSVLITDEASPYLADFLIDAEAVWAGKNDNYLTAGMWEEQIKDEALHFDATAIKTAEGSAYLIVQNVEKAFKKQQSVLQSAREVLLEHDEIVGEHEYIKQRLTHVLASNKQQLLDPAPIHQTIYHLETGVVVTRADGPLLFENESAKMLLCSAQKEDTTAQIHGMLTELNLNQQITDDLVKRKTSWQGELFWHNNASAPVWLQLTVHPVVDEANNHSHWIYVLSEISAFKQNEAALLPQTSTDSLTQLPNRHYFTVQLRRTIAQKTPFYLIYVDVKGFKHINNLHGYKAGDEILGAVAARLTKAVGELGFVARIASNEFALILNIKNKAVANDNALIFAEALQSTLRQPYDTSLVQGLTLDVCIGLVRYPEHAMSADELMRNCDLALYYAKYRLDNAICAFSDELKRHSEERYKLEESLRRAIENGELEVYLQPIIDLKANRVVKCEALARWQHADGEFISPEVFIPVAEQTGLIIPFGNWLIDEVCKILQRFKQQAVDVRVAINVSARQVSDQDTIDYIISSIESYQVNPKQLSVELTESVLVHSYESVSALLVKLRQLGVIVSIDDFGTGFSSLSYLKHLSIDELKVDKSFIQDVGIKNNEDSAIVLAILGLAKSLNLQVIAEGVETADQHQFLIDNNCDCAQGFLYSKPMTVAAFSSWYKDYASQP